MVKLKQKCQCPRTGKVQKEKEYLYTEAEKTGMNHKPKKCKGTNEIKLYKRDEKKLYLCSCCSFPSDEIISNQK